MNDRPPIQKICYISAEGNPCVFMLGRNGITEMREVEENSEYCTIPWLEVWAADVLVARFNQHKLEHILYQ